MWKDILLIVFIAITIVQSVFMIIYEFKGDEEVLVPTCFLNPISLVVFLVVFPVVLFKRYLKNDVYIRYKKKQDYFIVYSLNEDKFYKITSEQYDKDCDTHHYNERLFDMIYSDEIGEKLRLILKMRKRQFIRFVKGTDHLRRCPKKYLDKFPTYDKEIK